MQEEIVSKELIIEEKYLQELIDYVSSSTVGKIMKRHEILAGQDTAIKLATKELIYEGFRNLRDLVQAHDSGRNITVFKFKKTTRQKKVPTEL